MDEPTASPSTTEEKSVTEEVVVPAQEGDGGQVEDAEATAAEEGEEDDEIAELQKKVQLIQEEAFRIEQLQKQVEQQMNGPDNTNAPPAKSEADTRALDGRSIYIGNVDYKTTAEELQAHFQSCGTVNRVTIMCDKWTGKPKGFAYIEFEHEESVANALVWNESVFKGRQIKVMPKRTNIPGLTFHARRRSRRRRRFQYRPY